jgi:acyl-CoA synthetase (AMP-forming)/AMP-acid ligase II
LCRDSHPALVTADGDYSYAWLREAAASVCEELRERATFRAGDRVVLLAGNSPEYIAAFYGVLLAGGVVVPVPPDVEDDRLAHIIRVCDVNCVLTSSGVRPRRTLLENGGTRTVILRRGSGAPHPDASRAEMDDLACILFTSGSTGAPKGVMLSHGNLLSNAATISKSLDIRNDDRALVVLPFYHAFGNSILQTHVLTGATLILDGSLAFPDSILDALNAHRATSFSGVPEVYQLLLARSSLGRRRVTSLRYMAVAGGALDADAAQEVARRITPARFHVMYGQTEATARLSCLRPELLAERCGSIGKGLDGVTLEVVDESDRPVRPGERGEIRARGPNVMLGYWRDPVGTSRTLRRGWLYTGDWATVDADGFIYPLGRANGLVKLNGYRVHPSEVEQFVMRRLPFVRAIAVPYDAAEGGTRLALFIEPRVRGHEPAVADIERLCRSGLPRHKVPRYVEIVNRFPLNAALKLDRVNLAQRAAQAAAPRLSLSDHNTRWRSPSVKGEPACLS